MSPIIATPSDKPACVLICGVRGVDAIAEFANTEGVTRSVVILGYSGVQALDPLRVGVRRRTSISELARRAAMSPRHFTRVFTEEVGEAPGAYVERIRTDAARRQLEESDDTVTVVAARCGFGTAETMRRNFVRRLGISPVQYRKTSAHARSRDLTA